LGTGFFFWGPQFFYGGTIFKGTRILPLWLEGGTGSGFLKTHLFFIKGWGSPIFWVVEGHNKNGVKNW